MNYSDFDEIIEEDDFTGSIFGKECQLTVLGQCSKYYHKTGKHVWEYAVRCSVCAKDPELYGEGIFKTIKSSLMRGQIPCGCSKSARRDERYYSIICSRKAKELGYSFLGWAGDFSDRKTKIILSCPSHGEWRSGIINNFVNRGIGCPSCRFEGVGNRLRKPDEEVISKFMASGAFPYGTIFKRSSRKDNMGRNVYWDVTCPDCKITASSTSSSLNKGSKPCECSRSRQKIGYIKLISDNGLPIALKFGITSNVSARTRDFKKKTNFDISLIACYVFEDVRSCRNAETFCKNTLICGILNKEEMGDGFTETTPIKNLEYIQETYVKHGGTLLEVDL